MKTTKPSKVGLAKKRLQRITDRMQYYLDRGDLAGTITLVARRGQVAHFEVQGLRDIAANQPMSADTLFRIYSMTKPITSLAVLMLYEAGHFRLDQPVGDFLPAFNQLKVFVRPDFAGWRLADLERPVTVHDLLTHTAGLSYGFHQDIPIEALYRERDPLRPEISLAQLVDEVAQIPLVFQPGTAWRYSIATDVLGYLVEVVSGQPFETFLHERILEPLGMSDTRFYVPEGEKGRFAELYQPAAEGGLKPMAAIVSRRFVEPPRNCSGGGGLVSTAADYLRFCQMMLNRGVLEGVRLVSRKTVELMTANHLAPELRPIAMGPSVMGGYGFGLGVRVLLDPAQARTLGSVGEYGWGGLASTYFFIDPQEGMIGLLLTQLIPPQTHPSRSDFRVLAYQSIVD